MNPTTKKVLAYLKANPGSTITQICEGTRVCKRTVHDILNDLMAAAEVEKVMPAPQLAVYFLKVASPQENRLNAARQTALKLESKKLWNRAARQWLVAFDLARQVHDREEIARRREKCIRQGQAVIPAGYFQ